MSEKKHWIEWRDSGGGASGPHKLLMIHRDYVGHFYADASDGVNVAQVLEDIEIRYNSFDTAIAALRAAREGARGDVADQIDRALLLAGK